MITLNLANYIEQHRSKILEAGLKGFQELGRGALVVFPEQSNGRGQTEVKYLTEQVLTEDDDRSAPLVKRYDPTSEAILIVGLDCPKSVLVYLVNQKEAKVELSLSDVL